MQALDLVARELGNHRAVRIQHAWHVGEQHELLGAQRARNLARDGVGIDVERLRVGPGGQRRDDDDVALVDERLRSASG